MSYEFVLVERKEKVGYLTLNRPEKLNAMPRKMYQEISRALLELEADGQVWVVIVRGAGERAFSAGADLSLLHGALTSGPFEWEPFRPQRFDMGLQISKPVIAAIHGFCLAGGMELALSCDMRIAADDARFCIPAARLGLGYAYAGLKRLVDIVGPAYAAEIFATARRYDYRRYLHGSMAGLTSRYARGLASSISMIGMSSLIG